MADLSRLKRLGIAADVELMSLAPNDFRSVLNVVSSAQPQEIYNLEGQTSVDLTFDQSGGVHKVELASSAETIDNNLPF
jgi:GDPmannose 4,6-dehydratase